MQVTAPASGRQALMPLGIEATGLVVTGLHQGRVFGEEFPVFPSSPCPYAFEKCLERSIVLR